MVVGDALVVAHAAVAIGLAGRFALILMSGPLILAAALTLMVWRYRRGPQEIP
jgi:hypothetical protein